MRQCGGETDGSQRAGKAGKIHASRNKVFTWIHLNSNRFRHSCPIFLSSWVGAGGDQIVCRTDWAIQGNKRGVTPVNAMPRCSHASNPPLALLHYVHRLSFITFSHIFFSHRRRKLVHVERHNSFLRAGTEVSSRLHCFRILVFREYMNYIGRGVNYYNACI